jgi:hypothetical protein
VDPERQSETVAQGSPSSAKPWDWIELACLDIRRKRRRRRRGGGKLSIIFWQAAFNK